MKQILLINDVVGHSHVGMVAMWPILTYYGHAVYNLPTALVSNNFDYGDYSVMETTAYMRDTLPVWQRLHFAFDAVCTGYMFSDEQARLVADYSRSLAASGTALFVDPVMADSGSLYHGLDAHHIDLMRDMVSVADLTFPNYTEACLLTDTPFRQEGMTILLVEQNVRQSLKLCDRAYVLENGRIVLEGSGEDLLENERVRKAYLGI